MLWCGKSYLAKI